MSGENILSGSIEINITTPTPARISAVDPAVSFLISALRKIMGIPPATAPRNKNLSGTSTGVVSRKVISLAMRSAPAQAPTANFRSSRRFFLGSEKARLTAVIRSS